MLKSLEELCQESLKLRRRSTDKQDGPRSHLVFYTEFFEPYRALPLTMFEIGVNRGGSMRMWAEYFENARAIYGADIRPETLTQLDFLSNPKLNLVQLDQGSEEELQRFGETFGPFDLGIDDGSHCWTHQILTFQTLWPFMRAKSLYVIEDTETSFLREFGEVPPTCVDYFAQVAASLSPSAPDPSVYRESIDWVIFRENMIAIKHI